MFLCSTQLYTIRFHLLTVNPSPPLCQTFLANTKGSELFRYICSHLQLKQPQCFGLKFLDKTQQILWLNEEKSIGKQFGTSLEINLFFCVKFYVSDPSGIDDELTRYLFVLQVKKDILCGKLTLTFDAACKLFAYVLQTELGNFAPSRDKELYASQFEFVPGQSHQLELRAEKMHRTLKNVCQGEAEFRFLQEVRAMDSYGLDVHTVEGQNNTKFQLAICASGIIVFFNEARVASYMWSRVTKVSRDKKHLAIKVMGRNGSSDIHIFKSSSELASRHLWNCCNQHLQFFRNKAPSVDCKSVAMEISAPMLAFSSVHREPMKRRSLRQMPSDFGTKSRPKSTVITPTDRFHRSRNFRERRFYLRKTSAGSDTETYLGNTPRRHAKVNASDDERPMYHRPLEPMSQMKYQPYSPADQFMNSAAKESMVAQRSLALNRNVPSYERSLTLSSRHKKSVSAPQELDELKVVPNPSANIFLSPIPKIDTGTFIVDSNNNLGGGENRMLSQDSGIGSSGQLVPKLTPKAGPSHDAQPNESCSSTPRKPSKSHVNDTNQTVEDSFFERSTFTVFL